MFLQKSKFIDKTAKFLTFLTKVSTSPSVKLLLHEISRLKFYTEKGRFR